MRWLLLPGEWKQLRQVEHTPGALAFIEAFWSRRDPRPEKPGNVLRETFSQRVEAANLLYGEGGVKGSLTDRGRALILLGPPSHVRVASEPILAWDTQRKTRRRVTTRELNVEVWGYRIEDLPRRLLEEAREASRRSEEALQLTLSFRAESRRTYLVEGEALLKLAVRSACRGCE